MSRCIDGAGLFSVLLLSVVTTACNALEATSHSTGITWQAPTSRIVADNPALGRSASTDPVAPPSALAFLDGRAAPPPASITPDAARIPCTGARDDADAIDAALARLAEARHGTLRLVGTCTIAHTIGAQRWSGVHLVGDGDGNFGRQATMLRWVGPKGGTMLDWSSPGDQFVTAGSSIEGITFDAANLAGTAIRIRNLSKSRLDATILNPVEIGIDMDIMPTPFVDVSLNIFGNILIIVSNPTGRGLVMGRGRTDEHAAIDHSAHDVNSNVFLNTTILTRGGDGLVCGAADANTFVYLRTQGPAGSGMTANPPGKTVGLRLEGSTRPDKDPIGSEACRFNTFVQAQIYGRLRIENGAGAYPAKDNILYDVGFHDSFTLLEDANGLNLIGGDDRRFTGVKPLGVGTTSPARSFEVASPDDYQMRIGAGGRTDFNYDIGRNPRDGLLHFYGNQPNANGYDFWSRNGRMMTLRPDALDMAVPTKLPTRSVKTLPACAKGSTGLRIVVDDALAPRFLEPVHGGGAVVAPALCNGTRWVAG